MPPPRSSPTEVTSLVDPVAHRLLDELASELVGVATADGRLLQVSPSARAVLDRPPEDLVGSDGWDLVHPDDRARLRAQFSSLVPGEVETCVELRLRRREGIYLWMRGRGRPIGFAADQAPLYGFALHDVSAQREAEEGLRRAEARLHHLIDGLSEALAVLRDGRIQFVNPAHVRWLGYAAPDELCGRPLADLIHPDDRPRLLAVGSRLLATGSPTGPHADAAPHLDEVRFIRRDGEVVTAEVATQEVEFDGAPAILASARDISERKRIQARLLQADRMVSVGTLAAGVAHEINNPLACVIANLDCVTEDLPRFADEMLDLAERAEARSGGTEGEPDGARGPLAARLSELSDTVRDAREGAERVRLIVRDLRTLSRGDDDRIGPTDVQRVLDSSVSMVWTEIRHRARLVKEFGEVPRVDANEARLGQVFVALLLNAAQAIPEGRADKNEIRVSTRVGTDGRVIAEVRDTGAGIPEEIRARIFDPFFTTKPIGVGTGLGLSICASIVGALGGEVGVESEPGRGSTFRVTLPPGVKREPERPAISTPPIERRRARILVVDDEPMIGTSVRRSLGGEHEVDAVTSANEALELMATGRRFDLILCDLMMPVMTGMDFHAELARLEPTLVDRVVFVTGGAFTPRARAFLDRVANQRIEKPFDLPQLRALVRARLQLPGALGR